MSSLRRVLSSRANGAKSRGPVTEAGKLRSAANSLSHGLLARCTLLQGERGDALDNLMAAYVERFAPSGHVEYGFIEEMVSAHWRLRRLWAIETRSMDNACSQIAAPDALGQAAAAFAQLAEGPVASQIHRYETRLHRLHQRAMYNLLWLRRAVPEELLPESELTVGPEPQPPAPEDAPPPVPNEPSPISGHFAVTPPEPPAPPAPGPDLPVPFKLNDSVPNEPSPISGHPAGSGLPVPAGPSVGQPFPAAAELSSPALRRSAQHPRRGADRRICKVGRLAHGPASRPGGFAHSHESPFVAGAPTRSVSRATSLKAEPRRANDWVSLDRSGKKRILVKNRSPRHCLRLRWVVRRMTHMQTSKATRMVQSTAFKLFCALDRAGIHVLPKHYYTPVPDYAWLARNRRMWARRTDLTGVVRDLDLQASWLAKVCGAHYGEVQGLGGYADAVATRAGQGYGPIESQVLHCFLRTTRPKRIVEVGAGISTVCMLAALSRNVAEGAVPCELWCIEPYPRMGLSELAGMRLKRAMVQEIELAFFDQLDDGDLLFIDSSHALKTGSDVSFLYLEVIPRLRPGVHVHVHDVYLPFTYPRNVFRSFFGWQETALLLALLKGNAHLIVLCSLSALHYDRRGEMMKILADYLPQAEAREGEGEEGAAGHFPSSIWLRTA